VQPRHAIRSAPAEESAELRFIAPGRRKKQTGAISRGLPVPLLKRTHTRGHRCARGLVCSAKRLAHSHVNSRVIVVTMVVVVGKIASTLVQDDPDIR
jgi:hypothetical protein